MTDLALASTERGLLFPLRMTVDTEGVKALGGALVALAIFVWMTMPRGREKKTPF